MKHNQHKQTRLEQLPNEHRHLRTLTDHAKNNMWILRLRQNFRINCNQWRPSCILSALYIPIHGHPNNHKSNKLLGRSKHNNNHLLAELLKWQTLIGVLREGSQRCTVFMHHEMMSQEHQTDARQPGECCVLGRRKEEIPGGICATKSEVNFWWKFSMTNLAR